MDRVRAHRLHLRLLRELRALQRPDGGFPTSEDGAVGGRADRSRGDRAPRRAVRARGSPRRQRADGGFAELDGRVERPDDSGAGRARARRRRRARRALAYAIERRGLPLPNAADPERRVGWGWTADARSLVGADVARPARRQRADAGRSAHACGGGRTARASASATTAAGTSATRRSTTSTSAGTRRRPRSR